MKVTALKTFRPMNLKGQIIEAGETVDVSDHYGVELVRTGLAVEGEKALKDLKNKMLSEMENKGMPTEPETSEERSQGKVGPMSVADSLDVKNGGKTRKIKDPYFDKAGEDPAPYRTDDNAANAGAAGTVVKDPAVSGLVPPAKS
jgi:hypothetical protein